VFVRGLTTSFSVVHAGKEVCGYHFERGHPSRSTTRLNRVVARF
jgi:hypothetical protein